MRKTLSSTSECQEQLLLAMIADAASFRTDAAACAGSSLIKSLIALEDMDVININGRKCHHSSMQPSLLVSWSLILMSQDHAHEY